MIARGIWMLATFSQVPEMESGAALVNTATVAPDARGTDGNIPGGTADGNLSDASTDGDLSDASTEGAFGSERKDSTSRTFAQAPN